MQPGELVGIYTRLEAAVVTLVFEARVVGGAPRLSPETLEVRMFRPTEIPWEGVAFKTSWWGLRDWLARRHPEIEPPDAFLGRASF